MNDAREEELKQVPPLKKSTWPRGVRGIAIEEAGLLGVDNDGRLYWDGKPVAVYPILGSKPAIRGMSSTSPLHLSEPTAIAATFAAGQCQKRL